jgi:hypothetical protein
MTLRQVHREILRQAPAAAPTNRDSFKRVVCALLLFGISFGYVEAAVVVYLRDLYAPLHEQFHPGRSSNDLFPIMRLEQLHSSGQAAMRWLWTELIRELATLVMLASVGSVLARNIRQWFAGFMISFGVWDIAYYVFLKLLIDWPDSLFTWDLLFLLPVPWAGPVVAPVLVATSMILAGNVILYRELCGGPILLGWHQWLAILSGGAIVVMAFCWDYRNLLDGGEPNPFNWPVFFLGMGIGTSSFAFAVRPTTRT